jgi:hypothetical protein
MNKKAFILNSSLLVTVLVSSTVARAGDKPFKNGPITVVLDSPISTTLNKAGDTFTARVTQPAEIEGAIMEGHIHKVEPAQNGTAPKSHISFGFETITIGDSTYKVQADLKEVTNAKGVKKVDEEGEVIAQGNGMKKAMFGAGGAGLGSLAGGMLGGPVGALAGGMAGGALGYVVSLDFTTSGKNIDFFPGSTFVLQVTNKGLNKDINAADVRKADADAAAAQQKSPATLQSSAAAGAADAAPKAPEGLATKDAPLPSTPQQ